MSDKKETEYEMLVNTVNPQAISKMEMAEFTGPIEITEYEKEMNKNFITPEKLLEMEKQESQTQKQETEEDKIKQQQKDFITKVKVVALSNIGKFPLSNPSFFKTADKQKLIRKIKEIIETMNEDEITAEFNLICNEELFAPESDVSNYVIYNTNQ